MTETPPASSENNEIWKRRPNEPEKAWYAFRDWLTLPKRSVPELVKMGHNSNSIAKWKERHNWLERTLAYDNAAPDKAVVQKAFEDNDLPVVIDARTVVAASEAEDFSVMLHVWRMLFKAMSNNMSFGGEDSFGGYVNTLEKLLRIRLQLSDLGRRAVRLPRDYGALKLAEDSGTDDGTIIELTANGPKYVDRGEDINGEDISS